MGIFKKQNKVKDMLIRQWLTEDELIELIPLMDSSDTYHLCKQSQASSRVLIEALKYIDEIDARYVFRSVKFPSREIVKWANRYFSTYSDPEIYFTDEEYESFFENMKAILGNPNCPANILEKFFDIGVKEFDSKIACHKNISNKLFNAIIKLDKVDLLENLCRNEGLSKNQIDKLIALPFPMIHKTLLTNPIVDEGVFLKATKSSQPSSDDVNQRIKEAKSKRTSKTRFTALSRDTDISVRLALSTNTDLTTEVLEHWLTHENNLDVLLSVYENQYLSNKAEHLIWMELKQYEYGFGTERLTESQAVSVEEFLEDYRIHLLFGD
jgi:hypothetical protein